MQLSDITRMTHTILEQQKIESDFIEYKKSASFNDTILKTACAFANNYMNREIGLIFIGVEEIDDPESGEKAAPKRPISGLKEAKIEPIENQLKKLLSEIHPRVSYHLITDEIDDRSYLVIAVEPGSAGPYETSERAEKNKKIGLKAGRYIRVKRDTRLPNKREEFELLKTELATNCILHKDYDIKNYIGIYVYDDRITFVNHNRPLSPVTIEALNSEMKFDERNYLNPELKDMFFALNLIESYGSGIRRAKNAMAENHSLELVFAPTNDDDEYTMATAYINPEFAAIRAEEEKQNDLSEIINRDYPKTTQKPVKKTAAIIVEQMLENPHITRQELTKATGISDNGIKYQIEALKKKGVIERIGSKNGGYWKVNDV